MKLYCYPKCSTCKRAVKWLEDRNISFEYIDIKKNPPSIEEISNYYKSSELPLKRFFNTSGISYRALKLSEKFDNFSESELLNLLSEDGMLIKRPLLVDGKKILLGFKESKWEEVYE